MRVNNPLGQAGRATAVDDVVEVVAGYFNALWFFVTGRGGQFAIIPIAGGGPITDKEQGFQPLSEIPAGILVAPQSCRVSPPDN